MVKKSRGGQTINSCSEEGLKPRKLKKKRLGTILIEVAFTLPIVIYLILFCIELIKINIVNDALQSICEEATYLTISHDWENGEKWTEKIDAIIEKYRPSFIPSKAVIRVGVDPWASLETEKSSKAMLTYKPYGGSCIIYPRYEDSATARKHACNYSYTATEFIPSFDDKLYLPYNISRYAYYVMNENYRNEGIEGWPDNTVFVLTVTCNYPFSSSLVKILFGGGVNTKIAPDGNGCGAYSCAYKDPISTANFPKGTMYILWARGAGIVNPK